MRPRVPRSRRAALVLVGGAAALLVACETTPDLEELLQARDTIDSAEPAVDLDHRGPGVAMGDSGPARFAGPLFDAFRTKRAMDTVRFADPYFRAPASPGYDAVLDHVESTLKGAGFGSHPRLELKILERERSHPAWTPKRAKLRLKPDGGEPATLHAFEVENDRDRTMLPVNVRSCSVEGPVALHLADLEPGSILVTDASARQVLKRAKAKGAVAIVSSSLFPFNVDPSGRERHLDAIQFRELAPDTEMPVCQISPASHELIREAVEAGGAHLAFEAEVEFEERPLRTLVATIVGAKRPHEAVAISSHIQEPGACDNASGIAGLLEGARSLAGLLDEGQLSWPDRSVVFIWGDEFRQTEMWLESTSRTPVAGISSDMTGQSRDTGAIALLERHPDPGAQSVLPPDEHTPWGAYDPKDEYIFPNGLSVIARCAMADVSVHAGGWTTADHPWEGGSDHDVYIKMGVPAVLFWHFTDFTYHTSLDRVEFVDPEEMRRTGTALLATALAMADPRPGDLDRYLRSLQIEEEVRVDAASAVELLENVEAWKSWSYGARMWLRTQCLGPEAEAPPKHEEGR